MHWIDPKFLPEVTGTVELFLLNPHGESDGLVMEDETEVHFPPHLSTKIHRALKVGNVVKVRGVRPREGNVIAAISLQGDGNKLILDEGPPATKPPKPHVERQDVLISGTVRRPLHGPKGEVRGALLEDGQIVRFPPHEAENLKKLLKPGATMCVKGEALTNRHGTVIEARELGSKASSLVAVKHPKPPHKKPHGPAHKNASRKHAPA
jgi:hypothetical protein